MSQELFKLSTSFNCVPQGDERIALRLYYKHAATLLQHFEEWKDIDRFYFIPLRLNMAYFCAGGGTAVAFPPYFVGTILRNSLEHPDFFSAECKCGHRAYAYAYNGSPLSGRFDLSSACPECGAGISSTESGWRVRSNELRATQEEDLKRGAGWRCCIHVSIRPPFRNCCGSVESLMWKWRCRRRNTRLPGISWATVGY